MNARSAGRWIAVVSLLLALPFAAWWRAHTFAPSLRELDLPIAWPEMRGQTEPLDCDEAVYGYIGHRLASGAVMYRDLTENKPPLGYALYALAVRLGGPTELTIRLMSLPLVLGTMGIVWWLAWKLAGAWAAAVAAPLYALLATDPYTFGNGSNMEHMINIFASAALASMLAWTARPRRRWLIVAGVALGAASLVKQVAALPGLVFALAILLHRGPSTRERAEEGAVRPPPPRSGGDGRSDTPGDKNPGSSLEPRPPLDLALLAAAFAVPWLVALGILAGQGALAPALDDIFRYGRALATDTPPEPFAPPLAVRLVTGNADPAGALPPPFGRTDYLTWWGNGTWPAWVVGLPALLVFLLRPPSPGHRLVAAWTLTAILQVALPRLFWPHYYLLPLPSLATILAAALVGAARSAIHPSPLPKRLALAATSLAIALAIAATVRIQVRDYLYVPAEQLTVLYKGGRQWVTLRRLGRELGRRTRDWHDPRLFVWGWQSPLYFYSGLDGVTPQVFVDPLMKAFAGSDHPLIRPRTERILRDLAAHPPDLIFVGDPPFPALRAFIAERYAPSTLLPPLDDGRGLWVLRDRAREFG